MSLGKREKSNLFLFEEKFGIDCQNVRGNLQKFSQGLNNLFGEGAKVIEGLILQLYLGRLDISQKIIGSKLTLKITYAKLRNT